MLSVQALIAIRKVNLTLYPTTNFHDWSKLKAFADDKIIVTEKLKFVLGIVENIVGKGENAGYHHFLLFPTMFSKGFLYRVVESFDFVAKSQPAPKRVLV